MSENVITCERCSSEIPAGASVCPNCGAPVTESVYETMRVDYGEETTPVVESAEETPVEPEKPPDEAVSAPAEEMAAPEPPPVPVAPPAPVVPPAPPSVQPGKKTPVGWIIGGVIAFLVICCCCPILLGVLSILFMWK